MSTFQDNVDIPASVSAAAVKAVKATLNRVPTVSAPTTVTEPIPTDGVPEKANSLVVKGTPALPAGSLGTFALDTVSSANNAVSSTASIARNSTNGVIDDIGKMIPQDWQSISFQLSPLTKDMNEELTRDHRVMRKTINLASQIIEIVELVYQIVNALQDDTNNLYKVLQVLAKVLLQQLQEVLVSLASTGIYMLPITPDLDSLKSAFTPGGGFNSVMDKINLKVNDTKDPNRPIFNGKKDLVGGFIVVLTTGSNVGDLINNLDKLGALFGSLMQGSGNTNPPEGLKATPGLYSDPDSIITKKPGVLLEWNNPKDFYNVDTYHIYRSRTMDGTLVLKDGKPLRTAKLPDGSGGEELRVFRDPSFNGLKPVVVKVPKRGGKLTYLDFKVNDGETYYYKVVPAFAMADGSYAEGRVMSRAAEATVQTCIPDTPLSGFITETPDGFYGGANKGDRPDWQNTSLRGLLGPELDALFKELAKNIELLVGFAETSSDHFQEQLDNMKDYIKRAKEFLALFESVLVSLQALKFSGGAMILPLIPKETGLSGFMDRVAGARMSPKLQKYVEENSNLCSVAFAMAVVVGAPSFDSFADSVSLSKEDIKRMKEEGSFAETEAAWDSLKSSKATKDTVMKAFNFLKGALGG